MKSIDLKLRIDNLRLLIALEEENYWNALQRHTKTSIVRRLRENIKKFKSQLMALLDEELK